MAPVNPAGRRGEVDADLSPVSTTPAVTAADLEICAREPIHLSNAIQPHGCLIVCALDEDWTITRMSANAVAFLGLAPGTVLIGRPADEVFSRDVLHDIRNTLQGSVVSGSAERNVGMVPLPGGPALDLTVHASGSEAVIEFTPGEGADTSVTDPIVLIKSMIGRLKRAPTVERFLQLAASQVRSVTGYDRVMVYRFLPDDSGQVVGEALRPGLTPFMGLRYPTSDIPPQARELYKRQWLRMIVDVDYTPVPLLGEPGRGEQPLDLSLSSLRSVSPIHLEYIRNMGSAATLTVSLMSGDRLWGLIACHHEAPRRIAASTCAAAELFGQIFSLQVEARIAAEEQAQVELVRDRHDQVVASLSAERSLFDDLPRFAPLLQQLVPCDGVGLWSDGRFTSTGFAPPPSAMPALVALFERPTATDIVITSTLGRDVPLAATFADRVSGLIALRLTSAAQIILFLFRRELVQTVVWGGNPNKAVEMLPGGLRIGPRRSFEAWRETVRGGSAPWRPAEVQILKTLRVSLLDVILRQSDLISSERKAAQESQSLLIAELNHRVKNVLALIRSLVRQSRTNASSVEEFTADLEHRIRALAHAHDQLNQVGWRGAPLRRLLDAEVEAWAGTAGTRVDLSGPPVTLGSRAYQSLALVFHEMMTNAAKYGALSNDAGRLAIDWAFMDDGDLVIGWTETGGPTVSPPSRRGFGSVIMEQTVPFELQGECRLDYPPSGVVGRFTIPAAHLVEAEAAAPVASSAGPAEALADLKGKRLLLVEDSMMIALDAQAMLAAAGLEVEIAGNVADARRALKVNTFDAAVLDVNLSGETSFPIAETLAALKVPFVFATGYGESIAVPERFAGTAVVAKPYDERSLRRALGRAME